MFSIKKPLGLTNRAAVASILIGSIMVSPINQSLAISAETTSTPESSNAKIIVQPLQPKTIKMPIVIKKTVTLPKNNRWDDRRDDPATNLTGKVRISTTAAMKPLAQELIKKFNKKYKRVTVSVFGGQAGIGVLDVTNNRADLGIITRDLSSDENSKGLVSSRIGVDVIAMVVNPKNRVQNLTTSDVFNIYTKNITNWREVRGANSKISFNTYSSSVGLNSLFDSVFMRGQKTSDKVVIHSTTGSMLNTVKQKSNAIGYASLADVKRGIKALTINGVAPNGVNAKSGRYPFSRNVNMIYKGNKNAATNAFMQFVLSADGQKIINKYYYQIR